MQRNPLSAGKTFIRTSVLILSGLFLLSLTACGTDGHTPWQPRTAAPVTPPAIPPLSAPPMEGGIPAPASPTTQAWMPTQTKVALLLPLSGKGADTGEAMMKAAQLAMFDLNAGSVFTLMPQDTGTGAQKAVTAAVDNGATFIIGPVFSDDTKAVSPAALQFGVSVLSFSTDTTAAMGNTFLMGFMPQTQVEQVLAYSQTHGMKRIALIAPRDVYGDSVAASFYGFMQRYAGGNAGIIRYTAGTLPTDTDVAALGADAVLIAAPALEANKISNFLSAKGLPPTAVKRLGTGLWDQPDAAKLSGLQGAWYAASSPRLRNQFEHRYFETYGVQPPRLASLAYDATALAVVLTKSGRGFGRDALTNPSGFAGIDGIFRFSSNGLAERGLAILEINNGAPTVILDAPQKFPGQ